jgi:hypothetical protein
VHDEAGVMTADPVRQERRLILRVLALWEQLRRGRVFPEVGDLDSTAFGADWASCFVLALAEDGPRFAVLGDLFAGAEPALRAGSAISACKPQTLTRLATEFFPSVLERRIPVSVGGEGWHLGRPILFRAILLPLSDDDARIDALLGAANCRETL